MLSFKSLQDNIIELKEAKNEVDGKLSPFKEILNREKYSNYSFNIDKKEYSFKDTKDLSINLDCAGSFHLFFLSEGFDQDKLLKEAKELKEQEDSLNALFNFIKDNKPLFVLFQSRLGASINKIEVVNAYNLDIPFIYDENLKIKEEKKAVIDVEKLTPGETIVRNKFHFLLLLVATILFASSIPLAVLNIDTNNALWIFLIICSLIGIAMTEYAYYDYFKKGGFKSFFFLFSAVDSLFAVLVGSLVFIIFYNISNKPETDPGLKHYLVVGSLLSLATVFLVIGVTYIITKDNRKRPSGRL